MRTFAILIAVVVLVAGAVGAANPAVVVGLVRALKSRAGMWGSSAVHILCGTVFLLVAEASRLPGFVRAVAALALLSGVAFPLLGRDRFVAFVDWWERRPAGLVRAGCAVAAAAGGTLLYAVI